MSSKRNATKSQTLAFYESQRFGAAKIVVVVVFQTGLSLIDVPTALELGGPAKRSQITRIAGQTENKGSRLLT